MKNRSKVSMEDKEKIHLMYIKMFGSLLALFTVGLLIGTATNNEDLKEISLSGVLLTSTKMAVDNKLFSRPTKPRS
jgi:hypothetical protein